MSKIIKAHSLTGRITDGLMLDSFKAVKRNRGAAGIDKVSITMFEANLADNLRALMRDLKSGSFQPHPLRRHLIPKNETEFRPLGIPAVRDRVAQEVVRRLLNPIFEPLFHPSSYGFRHNRNCHMAVEAALKLHDEGFCDVVDADIQGFFDNLSHPIIMQSVAERVADGNILRLVEKFLTSGVMDNGVFKPTSVGTPQGGVVSPLDHSGYRFVRYADDFVVLCQTPEQAKEALAFVQQVLEQRLKLHLSPEKTKVTSYGKGYSFLGFVLSSRSRRMRPKSVKKFKDKVRKLTCRKLNLDQAQVDQLNRVIRGTARYFATRFFTGRTTFNRLDCWIRMRLRCMKTKSKSRCHHLKLQNKVFDRLGLIRLESFCVQRP